MAPRLPDADLKKEDEAEEEVVDHLSRLALEIEEKAGCKHATGISIVCKLCRKAKVQARESDQTDPGQ